MHLIRFCTLSVPLAVLLGGASGCASTATSSELRSSPDAAAATMAFENVTIDPVTVYVDHSGSRELLGHVGPRKIARLRIPNFRSLRHLNALRVIVVPLGTTRNSDGTPDETSAITSELEPPQHLVSMLWSLSGRTLVSEEIPGGGR